MAYVNADHPLLCDGCGIEVRWAPWVVGKSRYCCQDCAEGRPCDCGERQDLEDDRRGSPGSAADATPGVA